jgi:hypothetical protein
MLLQSLTIFLENVAQTMLQFIITIWILINITKRNNNKEVIMKKTFLILAVALMLAVSFVTASSAWVIVGDYGETGWQSFSFTSTQANGAWDYGATLTFGVSDALDSVLNSQLLIDNVKVTCNYSGYYVHFAESFESGLGQFAADGGYGSAATVTSALSSLGNSYVPTNGESMAKLISTKEILSNAFAMHGPNDEYYGPTTITFDWAFLAMDYMPFEDYSYAILKYSDGSSEYFQLGKIGVPEPLSILLLGLGLLSLGAIRRKM